MPQPTPVSAPGSRRWMQAPCPRIESGAGSAGRPVWFRRDRLAQAPDRPRQVQLLGLAAARLLTIEGAPAKDVRARMIGTCGRYCQAVGSFFTPDTRAETCPCYKRNPAVCRAGNKAVPEAGRGGVSMFTSIRKYKVRSNSAAEL